MLKKENINQNIRTIESRKARISALILSIVYFPMLLTIFNYYFKLFIETEKLSLFKFSTLSLVTALVASTIVVAITRFINSKYYIRDKQELKNAFVFSYLIYAIIQILYLVYIDVFSDNTKLYAGLYIIASGLVFYIFLFDYDVNKLGIYTDDLGDFIFYSTERKFIFKENLCDVDLQKSSDPLTDLCKIVKKQTKELPLQNDLNHVGKYYTYFIQKYDYEDKVYVLVYFSSTGKRNDEIISINNSYSKEEYTTKLEKLNECVNEYLKYD